MTTLYTADRSGTLREGMELGTYGPVAVLLDETVPLLPYEISVAPDGVSLYGVGQLYTAADYDNPAGYLTTLPVLNLVFEFVRQLHYPDRPSRYRAAFARDSIVDACKSLPIPTRTGVEKYPVWELHVEHDRIHRGDNRIIHEFLERDVLPVARIALAHAFWQGEPLNEDPPNWEFVVDMPARVGRHVASVTSDVWTGRRATEGGPTAGYSAPVPDEAMQQALASYVKIHTGVANQ